MSINRFTEDMAFAPVFQADQLSHAYLVSGGDAGTRSALARTLAAAIVCIGGDRRPCGTCAQCKKALRGVHPDILHVEKPKDKASIPVDTVRAVCADAAVIPNDADAKVYIFDDASVLFPPAQNAMLKTLEEPPGKAAFILCLENPGLMLDTVRSRCVEIDLMPPAEQDGEKAPYVQAFFDALGEGNFALIRYSFSLDKLISSSCGFCRQRPPRGGQASAAVRFRGGVSVSGRTADPGDRGAGNGHHVFRGKCWYRTRGGHVVRRTYRSGVRNSFG